MLSQKIRKMGTAKKHCKTQELLMVGGLSWGYVPILRPMLAPVGPSRATRSELDDGWPESEKDVFQAALRMVVVKDSR